jgi:hypothetical protein
MTDEALTRLRDAAGSLEQELLRSGHEDVPAPGAKTAAMARVLEQQRRELAWKRSRTLAVLGGAVALAAGVALSLRAPKPAPPLAAEPPPSHSVRAMPAPSASLEAPSPLAPCSPVVVAAGQDATIDDFEDGDSRLLKLDKRAGSWIAFGDGTAPQLPRLGVTFAANRIPGGRGKSQFGLHTSGGTFKQWGTVLSAELTPRRCYDASAYAGVTFWARGKARLRVGVKMTQVVAEEFGGSCLKDCFDGHSAERALSKDWQRFEVRWEELSQSGFGPVLPFDPHSLFAIEFAVPANRPPFDYWLDDVAFLPR